MMWKNGELFYSVPFPKVEDRPLIVYHPAADMNYINSWSIMVENGDPFILFCDELSPMYPDNLPFIEDSLKHEYFARIANPLTGGRAYRNPELGFQNMLIHRQKDATKGIHDLPLIDVLYLDWLDPFLPRKHKPSFSDIMPKLAKQVRNGGLIILDRKHAEVIPEWFAYSNLLLSTKHEVCIEHIGRGDWPIPYVDLSHAREVEAEVFKVTHSFEQTGVNEFLASLMMERRLTPEDLTRIKYRLPARWPGHPDRDSWFERYMDYLDFPEIGEPTTPCPPHASWSINEYSYWVQSLIDNPKQLRPMYRIERTLDLGIKVTFVNGDILDHLDWLYSLDASVIARANLHSKCMSKCCWLQFKSVDLQPKWEKPLIQNLIWSGDDTTADLTLKILELSKGPIAATIVHGQGKLYELGKQLERYDGDVKHLIIFHKDAEDFTD